MEAAVRRLTQWSAAAAEFWASGNPVARAAPLPAGPNLSAGGGRPAALRATTYEVSGRGTHLASAPTAFTIIIQEKLKKIYPVF